MVKAIITLKNITGISDKFFVSEVKQFFKSSISIENIVLEIDKYEPLSHFTHLFLPIVIERVFFICSFGIMAVWKFSLEGYQVTRRFN
ncbi:MAG TPA: hypothetical protein EYH19_01295 [Desulfocapsa sulfexigens]|nr:hypothetical protein [Desulfocapsa sulfexigens]